MNNLRNSIKNKYRLLVLSFLSVVLVSSGSYGETTEFSKNHSIDASQDVMFARAGGIQAAFLWVWAGGTALLANGLKDIGSGCFNKVNTGHDELKDISRNMNIFTRETYYEPEWFTCAAGMVEEAIGAVITVAGATGWIRAFARSHAL